MTPELKFAMEHSRRIRDAYMFALAAHSAVGQTRATLHDADVPYIVHPVEVAGIVLNTDGVTEDQVVSALLHDTVEDTAVTIELIEATFGPVVATYVDALTDLYTPKNFPDVNRADRKALEANRMSFAAPEVKTIKLADGISNTPSIAENRPTFLPTYGKEKRALMESLRGGDVGLWTTLDTILTKLGY